MLSNIDIGGNLTVGGSSSLDGGTFIGTSLEVNGQSTFNTDVTVNAAAINFNGTQIDTLVFRCNGFLDVTGETILASVTANSINVTTNSTFNGNVLISGGIESTNGSISDSNTLIVTMPFTGQYKKCIIVLSNYIWPSAPPTITFPVPFSSIAFVTSSIGNLTPSAGSIVSTTSVTLGGGTEGDGYNGIFVIEGY